jgi:biotin transport system substrate-specific component
VITATRWYRRGPGTFTVVTATPAPSEPVDASPAAAAVGRDVALVSVFGALIVVFGLVPAIPVNAFGVEITLQTLGIMLAGLVLGPWRGVAAVSVYVALGLAGLPVFAGGVGGLGVLATPSLGYIIGWFPGVLLTGLLAVVALRRSRGRMPRLLLAALLGGLVVVYLFGWLFLVLLFEVAPVDAFLGGVAVFVPLDVVKAVVAAFVAASVHRAFPDVLARRAGQSAGPAVTATP